MNCFVFQTRSNWVTVFFIVEHLRGLESIMYAKNKAHWLIQCKTGISSSAFTPRHPENLRFEQCTYINTTNNALSYIEHTWTIMLNISHFVKWTRYLHYKRVPPLIIFSFTQSFCSFIPPSNHPSLDCLVSFLFFCGGQNCHFSKWRKPRRAGWEEKRGEEQED